MTWSRTHRQWYCVERTEGGRGRGREEREENSEREGKEEERGEVVEWCHKSIGELSHTNIKTPCFGSY